MSRFRLLHVLVAFAVCTSWACEKVALTAPTASTIALTVNTTVVPINGSAEVVAVVTEAGGTAVHNGTMVTFTSSFGRMDPIEAPTSGGKAVARFIGTSSGTAKLGAFSGGARVATELEVKVGAAATERVTVRTEPATIPRTGGTVQVITTVSDISGNPLPNAPVSFTLDFGSLSSSSGVTDANGEVRVTLTTNRTSKVTAASGAKTGEFTVTALQAPTVAITTCTATQSVGVSVNCTITPTPASDVPIQNMTVNWGDNTGEQPLGGNTSATSASHTYTAPGTYTMTATAIDLNAQRGSASIAFVVNRVLPTGTLTVPTTGTVGVAVAMSFAPGSPPQPITNVTIEFGDGTTRNLGAVSGTQGFTRSYASEGGYIVTAVITDASGQQGRVSAAITISRSASPTITFTQTSNTTPAATPGVAETFSVSATAASGLTIRSIVVTKANGDVLYDGNGGGTFANSTLTAGDILTAKATDSSGNSSTTQLVVQ